MRSFRRRSLRCCPGGNDRTGRARTSGAVLPAGFCFRWICRGSGWRFGRGNWCHAPASLPWVNCRVGRSSACHTLSRLLVMVLRRWFSGLGHCRSLRWRCFRGNGCRGIVGLGSSLQVTAMPLGRPGAGCLWHLEAVAGGCLHLRARAMLSGTKLVTESYVLGCPKACRAVTGVPASGHDMLWRLPALFFQSLRLAAKHGTRRADGLVGKLSFKPRNSTLERVAV